MVDSGDLCNSGTLALGHNKDWFVTVVLSKGKILKKQKSTHEREKEPSIPRSKLKFYKSRFVLDWNGPIFMK